MSLREPDFICVGAAKCGTTTLYEHLRSHPEIFVPDQKELHYFSSEDLIEYGNGPGMARILDDICRSKSEYMAHFKNAQEHQVVGEVSPSYLHYPNSISRMKELTVPPKIIILLRNPAERVLSQYMHMRRAARESLSFEDALAVEEQRVDQRWGDMWHYTRSAFVADKVKLFLDAFGARNVIILTAEQLGADPVATMRSVYEFLGVNPEHEIRSLAVHNRSGLPRSKVLARLLNASPVSSFVKKVLPRRLGSRIKERLQVINTGPKKSISAETKRRLAALYDNEILKLEHILGRATGWRNNQ